MTRTREPLTARQRDVLRALARWWRREGMAPTLAELAREVGVFHGSTVLQHMRELSRKGYVRHARGRTWRAWEII